MLPWITFNRSSEASANCYTRFKSLIHGVVDF
jgi:hypothetical protein